MTIRAELPPVDTGAAPAPRRRRPWRRLLVVAVSALLVAAAVSAVVYVNSYQPIGSAGFSQGYQAGPGFRTVTDGLGSESYVILGPPGAKATVSYTLANNGPFDIRLMPAPTDIGQLTLTYRWSPVVIPQGDGSGRGPEFSDTHPVPFTWKSHQAIQLWVTVTKPACSAGGTSSIDQLPLHWKSLGVSHLTWWKLDAQVSGLEPIGTCFPKSTLRNVQPPG